MAKNMFLLLWGHASQVILVPREKRSFLQEYVRMSHRKYNQHMSLPHAKCVFPIENKGFAPSSTALCLFARLFWVVVHNLKWDYYTSIKMGISIRI